MSRYSAFLAVVAFIFTAVGVLLGAGSESASAQSLRGMSCNNLWYERNQIYAQNGYCFKTRKGRAVFGPGCFPPYGRLGRYEENQVARIKRQERRLGCRAGGRAVAPPPRSSGYAGMSCNDLWHERNSIFARNGQCFKSARGRTAFGRGCFPPYGKLGRNDQRKVNNILKAEGRNGCR